MKKIDKYIPFSVVLLASVLLMSVGMVSAETYVITGGGAMVTVDGPSIDKFTGGSFAASIGDVTAAETKVVTSSDGVSSSGKASADSKDNVAASGSVSWGNAQDTSAGYAYAVAVAVPDPSGDITSTEVSTDVEGSVSGFFVDAEGSATVS